MLCLADKAENEGASSPSVQPVKDEPIQKVEQPIKEETTTSKPYCDVVNVSEGFQLRTAYKKKVKPSKLDGLLERRVKQFTLEEKQRLERMRQAALLAKTPATKSTSAVKNEGSSFGKQQPDVNPCVKEEEEENLQMQDVVKKLDFEQEQMETKVDKLDVKADVTAPQQTEVNALKGNGGEAHKEVNGESLGGKKNCLSDAIESEEPTQTPEVAHVGENGKKRGYEEIEQGSRQSDTESMDAGRSETSPVQVNGGAQVAAPADSNISKDPDSPVQGDFKDPVKTLMNGSLLQSEVSDMCHPPPLKVPKLENHVTEKGDSLKKNEDVATNSQGTASAKLPSSSTSNLNSNSMDSGGVKTTSAESQNALQSNVKSQAASSTVPAAAQPSSRSAVPQKTKAPASTTTGSMTISKEYSTRDRVSLLRFSKSKKARSGTALPSYCKFVTKSSKKSIFILPRDDLKRLARRGSNREVPIFNYNAKPAPDIWPYPSPRPTFGITWRWVYILLHLEKKI